MSKQKDKTPKRKPKGWTHPVHGRGIRSPDYTRGLVGALLSDRKIHEYALAGRYGSEIQLAAIANDKAKTKKPKKETGVALALKALGL